MPSAGSRSDGAFSAYSGITGAGSAASSRRATFATPARATPKMTTVEAMRRPANSMSSERIRDIDPRIATGSATTTRMSELVLVQLLGDLAKLRLAGLEMLRRVAELHDRGERRHAVLEVGFRLLQRILALIAREQRCAPAAQLSTPHVCVSHERAVAAGERVAPLHGRVERLAPAVHGGEHVQLG